ncbi:MAG: hypothetical protein A3F17_04865 [Gammaproteobacteria bacterium RIFCSPHIGHO2_12_FULL_41_15]|nr:MAG: hypothetical protein A3F17_04865 [Gammaproteobacteria bacterium RIFCSPHIGHO2_12_FULL_41_15]
MQSASDTPEVNVDQRQVSLRHWLEHTIQQPIESLNLIHCDASFRRYFRLKSEGQSYVVMDAPPEKENTELFLWVAHAFEKNKINVPAIYASDLDKGFVLLSDFGDRLLQHELTLDSVDKHYAQAINSIVQIQKCPQKAEYTFPSFNEKLYVDQFNLFRYWYLTQGLHLKLNLATNKLLEKLQNDLMRQGQSQPQCCVHQDFHSRNLLLCENGELGIIDFQDAVWGPVTYDITSLLRDCYIEWPIERVYAWLDHYQQRLLDEKMITETSKEQFQYWFDWVGLQRNLKNMGIFTRLALRDGKTQYLSNIPRVIRYAQYVCAKYPELAEFSNLFNEWTKQ